MTRADCGIVKAAYCVTRDPTIHGGTRLVPFEGIYEMVKEGAGLYGKSLRRGGEDIMRHGWESSNSLKLSRWGERGLQQSVKDQFLCGQVLYGTENRSFEAPKSLSFSGGASWQESNTVSPVLRTPELEEAGESRHHHPAQPSKSFEIPNLGSLDEAFSHDSLASPDIPMNGWYEETLDLLTFDVELASQSFFAEQLGEYTKMYGVSEDGFYLGLHHESDAQLQTSERDRLQVWPEKVATEPDRFKGEGGDIWVEMLEGEFGEAGEYMDMMGTSTSPNER